MSDVSPPAPGSAVSCATTNADESFGTSILGDIICTNENITTPLKKKVPSSSFTPEQCHYMSSTPLAATTKINCALFYETPKEQIRPSIILSGHGEYDWNQTARTAPETLQSFQHLFRRRQGSRPVSQSSLVNSEEYLAKRCRNESNGSTTSITIYSSCSSNTRVRFEENTTEEEISFTLSQDMEMENSQESPLFEGLFAPPLPSVQRCKSASLPFNSASRRPRRRSVSVEQLQYLDTSCRDRSASWNIDTSGPLFSDFCSPRNSSGLNCRRKDPDDCPLFSSSCSDIGVSRCTSTITLDFNSETEVAISAPSTHGSMFGSPSIAMASLDIAHSPPPVLQPPPPIIPLKRSESMTDSRSKYFPPPMSPHFEDVEYCPPSSPPNCVLFSPPRNRRGRSESFEVIASSFELVDPPEFEGLPEDAIAMFTPIISRFKSSNRQNKDFQ